MKYIFIIFTLASILTSCSSTKRAGKTISWTEIAKGNSSGMHTSSVELISSADAWEQLWAEMHASQSPAPALPEVNFDEKILLAAFRGDCATGGYGLTISDIKHAGKQLKVQLVYTTPGLGCMNMMMITQPYEIVAIEKMKSGELAVAVENIKVDCEEEEVLENVPLRESVSWEEVASGTYCGYSEEKRMLIKDLASWEALWAQVGSNEIPPPDLPQVNFEEKALVAMFMGDRSNGGYGQSIKKMEMENGRLVVRLVHASPGKNCISTMAIVQPYTIVAIDKEYAKDASFAIEKVVRDCK